MGVMSYMLADPGLAAGCSLISASGSSGAVRGENRETYKTFWLFIYIDFGSVTYVNIPCPFIAAKHHPLSAHKHGYRQHPYEERHCFDNSNKHLYDDRWLNC